MFRVRVKSRSFYSDPRYYSRYYDPIAFTLTLDILTLDISLTLDILTP